VVYGFQTLGLKEIVATTVPANTRSRRVMEKLGMTHDSANDFEHPLLPERHPLRRHVLYRLRRSDWRPQPANILARAAASLPPNPSSRSQRAALPFSAGRLFGPPLSIIGDRRTLPARKRPRLSPTFQAISETLVVSVALVFTRQISSSGS